ncbi:phytanoyl-CoA dioxygenase [Patellaria atrata CBS 101060]|uniref:Phytanoyl-CoA dioxygenase n=1 Tax=Patellaria atrata CBS 101060 TaxID=1346257 RepID=A0A9P4SCM7_9PEZI|nr:phytanoyl-CoA dioxygenase [Patellaria atrata CBS 101060]
MISIDAGLSEDQLQFWDENGYLLIPEALDPSTVSELVNETHQMLDKLSLEDHPMTKFSTGQDGNAHVGDDYFLTSGDKVRFFFEEDAFSSSGELIKPKQRAINKIGHYLHHEIPSFRKISLSQQNTRIARSLNFRDPRVLQSMIICKSPEIGGRVPPHQDSTFLYTNPPSAVGFWYALEDATKENGCLSFAKGSHKRTPIKQRFVRTPQGGTGFIGNDGAEFPEDIQKLQQNGTDRVNEEEEEYTMGEVKAGTLVLIHGNLLHKSEKNTSSKSRFIYTFHVIEGQQEYDEKNWLQPPAKGFSRLYS